jgi:hypothetical protein
MSTNFNVSTQTDFATAIPINVTRTSKVYVPTTCETAAQTGSLESSSNSDLLMYKQLYDKTIIKLDKKVEEICDLKLDMHRSYLDWLEEKAKLLEEIAFLKEINNK